MIGDVVGARAYDPAIGQFLSVDPVLDPSQPQSLNGYSYASNTPVTASDPSGLWCSSCNDGQGWTRPDGGTSGDPDGGKNPDGSVRGTPGFPSTRPTTAGSSSSPGAGQVITDLGSGTPALPPPDVYHDYQPKLPGIGQMGQNGTYMPELSYELNVELYFRERCSFSWTEECESIRAFYTHGEGSRGLPKYWTDIQDIPSLNTCPVCDNIGFDWLMATLPIGRLGKFKFKPGNCFLAGTDILMADGETKDIKDIEVGDMVLAADPETGEEGPRRVTAPIRSVGERELNTLTISTPNGSEEITATHDHPFWSPSEHAWVKAGDLAPGMTLRTDLGEIVRITKNSPFGRRVATYNFTVEKFHTYYVLAGETPVLVHNSNCGIGRELIGDERADHILDGHRYPGAPGKDAFPQGWSDDQILDAVADVVTSPNSQRTWYKGSAVHAERTPKTRKGEPAVQNVIGSVGGVRILVRYEPLTGKVLTAFPH